MSVRKRGNGWIVTVYDPLGGKNRWIGTFPTRHEAKQAEATAARDARKRRLLSGTVRGFSERWLDEFPRPKQSTRLNHAALIRSFVRDIGDRELSSIGRAEARTWALSHRAAVHAARAMFSDAKRIDLCDHNPFSNLGFPESRGRKDLEAPSRKDVAVLAGLALERGGPPFRAMVLMAAYTGMRPGELFALRWPAVDLKGGEVHVLEQYSSAAKEFTLPKNGLTRTVVLPPPARDGLLELGRGDGFVFLNSRGNHWTQPTLHYYWDKVREAFGRPDLDFYSLRHACAAHMLNDLELAPQDIAHQLGHTDGGVLVMKLYGHPSEVLARERIKRAFVSNVSPLRDDTSASSSTDQAGEAS